MNATSSLQMANIPTCSANDDGYCSISHAGHRGPIVVYILIPSDILHPIRYFYFPSSYIYFYTKLNLDISN